MVKLFFMSGERLIDTDSKLVQSQTTTNYNPTKKATKINGRVDINKLMFKVRNEENKQRKENLLFLGIISSVIVVIGIVASL